MLNNWHILHNAAMSALNLGHFSRSTFGQFAVSIYFLSYIIISVTIYLNMLISHFLSTYNEETRLQREARETMSETTDINSAVDQINRAISGGHHSTSSSTDDAKKDGDPYKKGNVCINHCCIPNQPAYNFCAVSSKLYPATECPFVLEPTIKDQYGAVNGYEPITIGLKWLSESTVIVDGHNNSEIELDNVEVSENDEVILKPQKKATPLHKKRRDSNIIGDVDKALKLLENVDATMKKESEKALKEESRLRRTRSGSHLK